MQPLTKNQIRDLALKYTHIKDFRRENKNAYYRATHKRWWVDISKHMKRINRVDRTIEDVLKVAYQYDVLIDFINHQRKLYKYAKDNNWLVDVTKHMIKNRQWFGTQEELNEIMEVAKKYRTRKAFQEGSPNYHYAARKYNWLPIVCEHMEYYPEKNPNKKHYA